MSSVDPLAVVAAQIAATQTGTPDASLDLGAIAQILQAQLAAGDVLEATILPAQNGQDLISILGQVVVAQLPTDVHPGDVLLLQVTGFQGNQILVRNLGVQDPNNPVPTFIPDLPPQEVQGSSAGATLTTIVGNPNAALPPVPSPQTPVPVDLPLSSGPPIAPPTSVFVAASVRPAQAAQSPVTAQAPLAPTPATQSPAAEILPPPASPAQASPARLPLAQAPPEQPVIEQPAPPVDVESRLAAARAASTDRPLRTPPPTQAPAHVQPAASAAPPARPINLPTAPPLITRAPQAQAAQVPNAQIPAARSAAPASPASQAAQLPPAASQIAGAQQSAPSRGANVAAQLADALASKEPVRILAALHVPATPVTLAAARLVSNASTQVQAALQNLEQALSQARSSDARVATLQTLTTFISHFEPRSAPALSAQLSTFVSNILGGAETKISQLLGALAARDPQAASAGAPTAPAIRAEITAPAHVPIIAEARAAERQMAISQDLKSTLLSLLADPPAGGTPQLSQAVSESLVALTAMQFNSLIANQQDPSTLAMSIPLVFYDGGQASNIRVSRDAPDNKTKRLDADNFHIAFVLDTQALGTVAIDLETVGRAVKVAVKTDRASAVDRFNSSLGDLRARLEHLRYNVTSTGADMVSAPVPQEERAVPIKTSNLDLQA